MRVTRVGAGGHTDQAHHPHEPLHTLAIHGLPNTIQRHGYPSAPVKGGLSLWVINVSHPFLALQSALWRIRFFPIVLSCSDHNSIFRHSWPEFWIHYSRLVPIPKVARTINNHLWDILNAIMVQASNGVSESMNSRIQGLKVRSRGFRNKNRYIQAICFHFGGLDLYPEGVRR